MASVAVCFVCLGNICRSPTAEGVFRRLVREAGLEDEISIDSAGTAAYHAGETADRRAAACAERRGCHLDSVARRFQPGDFDRFDYVLAMDAENLSDLSALRKVHGRGTPGPHLGLLRDFDRTAPKGSSVPDPYYGGGGGFEEVFDMCERACAGLLEHIKQHNLR